MKKIIFLCGCLFFGVAHANRPDSLVLRELAQEIMTSDDCFENLRYLTKTIGHRISGSPAAAESVEWARRTLEVAGADSVWLQPVYVPHWVRGEESLRIAFAGGDPEEVPVLALGGSGRTGGKPLKGEVLRISDMRELESLSEEEVRGRIVFFDYAFRQDFINTFDGYSDAVSYRWAGPMAASRKKAAAVIIRSIGTSRDDHPHAGSTSFREGTSPIPALAIGQLSADRLAKACSDGKVTAILTTESGYADSVLSYNVVAELRGAARPDELLMVSGHLDSWDVGEGAHDDGAGIVQSIEVLRAFSRLGIRPRRTLRVVCFMNEENGLKGAYAYARATGHEHHLFALESDAGGFSPRGIGIKGSARLRALAQQWKPLLAAYELYDFEKEWGGVDLIPLEQRGIPVGSLVTDSQRYFDIHHSSNDVFESVHPRELKLGALAMAAFLYLTDQHL